MTKALVVGGAGFIGSHLVEALQNDGMDVVVVDNLSLGQPGNIPGVDIFRIDASDILAMRKVCEIIGHVDVAFNLAVVPLPVSLSHPKRCFDVNVSIVSVLCELARLNKIDTLIQFSSSEVYGSLIYTPQDEEHPLFGRTPYAASKAAGDLLVQSYARTFGIDYTIVRPFNTIGPRQNSGSYAGLIPATIKRLMHGKPALIHGDGSFTRDYSYVTDVARAAVDIYHCNKCRGEIINIGSGEEHSVEEVVMAIAELFDADASVEYTTERPGDVARMRAGAAKAVDLIGYFPTLSFEEALENTISWYVRRGRLE
jgi:UDP-glucose 4-epimerase